MKTAHNNRQDIWGVTAMAALLTLAGAARADAGDTGDTGDASALSVSIGLGVGYAPKFPGSDRSKGKVLPMLKLDYGRFFVGGEESGSPGFGVKLLDNPHWKAGIAYSFDFSKPRQESDDERLSGLGDIARTSHISAFGVYKRDWYALGTNVSTAGHGEGTRIEAFAKASYDPAPRLTLSAGPKLVWADQKYNQTFFGVDAGQASRSGLAEYHPKSGINSMGLEFGADYKLDKNWLLLSHLTLTRLQGDAATSPITERKNQQSINFMGLYHF